MCTSDNTISPSPSHEGCPVLGFGVSIRCWCSLHVPCAVAAHRRSGRNRPLRVASAKRQRQGLATLRRRRSFVFSGGQLIKGGLHCDDPIFGLAVTDACGVNGL